MAAAKKMKFTAGWQVSNPIAVLRHAVLQLHPIQLLQQRGAKQHHGQSRADTLTDIHRETRDVKRPCRLSVDNRQGQEHSAGVQQWADEQDTGQKLPIDDAAVRSLLDNQLRRYFAEQIEGWGELEGLTEQQITEMVAAPNVPQRIRRQLEKNGFLMDSFWESVAKASFDLVRQYKEKLI